MSDDDGEEKEEKAIALIEEGDSDPLTSKSAFKKLVIDTLESN